jgi:hypothetical protein
VAARRADGLFAASGPKPLRISVANGAGAPSPVGVGLKVAVPARLMWRVVGVAADALVALANGTSVVARTTAEAVKSFVSR